MDIVLPIAGLIPAPASDALESQDVPHSNYGGDRMTLGRLIGTRIKSGQFSVRLPGAGTVSVDVEKHVDKALKAKTNGLSEGNRSTKPADKGET